jgi:hypothetical protein
MGPDYQFTGGGCDAVCINTDKPVVVSGISLCPWRRGSTSADVSIYVIEGSSSSGRVLAQRLLHNVQLDADHGTAGMRWAIGAPVPLMFEHPIHLEPERDYTLALQMQGDMVHDYCQGPPSIKFDEFGTIWAAAPVTSVSVSIKPARIDGPPPNLNLDNGMDNYLAGITDHTHCQIPCIYLVPCGARPPADGGTGGVINTFARSASGGSVAATAPAEVSSPPAAAVPSAPLASHVASGVDVLRAPTSLLAAPPASSAAACKAIPECFTDE